MSDPIRIGFVGAGQLARRVHYPSLAELGAASLAAIAERDPDRLSATADQYGVYGRYYNHREMLDHENLDAVYVVMAPHLLHDIVVDCLQAGKHVFVEKPPGVTTYQTEAFAWYAAKHGCRTMTGFNRRFVPLLRHCKELLEAAGPLHLAVASFHKYEPGDDEFGFFRGAVSHLTSDIIHSVDALRWFAGGEVKDVVAHTKSVGRAYANTHVALIEFDSGCSGVLLASRRSGTRRHTFELHGGDVAIYSDDHRTAEVFQRGGKMPTVISAEDLTDIRALHRSFGFLAENRHFLESIQAETEPITNFEDAVKTMRLVDQIAAQVR